MRVLVMHSGLQHAHQLAWALEESGHLVGFWTGVPVEDARTPGVEFWSRWRRGIRAIPVDREHRRHLVVFPLLQRMVTRLLPTRAASALSHRLDHAFDAWVAGRVRQLKPDMVICYENSARQTFRAAHAIGAVCVLDAASIHYAKAKEWGGGVVSADPAWVDQRKQEEIDLADAILTCSQLAADTYSDAGVLPAKLFPTPLGTILPTLPERVKALNRPCSFVFMGSTIRRKGIDVLIEVFRGFARDGIAASLTVIGGGGEADLVSQLRSLPNVFVLPFMPQAQLLQEVAGHDCLVLPSRFDSFGMVVPEAMAVGVPALVTDRVGAKCIFDSHPDAGWVVPCEIEAIRGKMLDIVANRGQLLVATAAARSAAQDYQWSSYRSRVVTTLEKIYSLNRPSIRG